MQQRPNQPRTIKKAKRRLRWKHMTEVEFNFSIIVVIYIHNMPWQSHTSHPSQIYHTYIHEPLTVTIYVTHIETTIHVFFCLSLIRIVCMNLNYVIYMILLINLCKLLCKRFIDHSFSLSLIHYLLTSLFVRNWKNNFLGC